uniref:Uncharacterized protein n=1 Tax=Plectus sambesii TaxID=2011161 RepID=A0A914WI37_9BILA
MDSGIIKSVDAGRWPPNGRYERGSCSAPLFALLLSDGSAKVAGRPILRGFPPSLSPPPSAAHSSGRRSYRYSDGSGGGGRLRVAPNSCVRLLQLVCVRV